jgi:hypothetical protein
MSHYSDPPLSFETMLTDPLTRTLMEADGVSLADLIRVMETARDALVARERRAPTRAASLPAAMNGPA